MQLFWEHKHDYDGMRLVTRQEAILAYLADIPASDRRRHMRRKADAANYANQLNTDDAWVRYADAKAEIDRLRVLGSRKAGQWNGSI